MSRVDKSSQDGVPNSTAPPSSGLRHAKASIDVRVPTSTVVVCGECHQLVDDVWSICTECGMPLAETLDGAYAQELKTKLGKLDSLKKEDSSPAQIQFACRDIAFCYYREAMRIINDPRTRARCKRLLAQALVWDPINAEIAIKYSYICNITRECDAVEPTLRHFTGRTDLSDSQRRRILTNLACAINFGPADHRFTLAETYCREGLKLGESEQLYENLGLALQGQNRLEESIAAFELALLIDSDRQLPQNRIKSIRRRLSQDPSDGHMIETAMEGNIVEPPSDLCGKLTRKEIKARAEDFRHIQYPAF